MVCVSLCVAILSILLPPSLSVPSTSSVPKNQHQHHQRHDSNDHNNVIWCPMPTLAKNNTLLWKDINNTVHCPYPVILTSPRIDSYAVFKQKICTVHTQHSMLLRAIYKEHKHILPADAHFNSPMWVGYGLLLWSIRHLRPKLFDALWLEFGVASTASTNLTAHAQRYNCGEVLQQQQQGEGEGEGSKEGFVTSCETPPLAPIIGFDSFQGLPTSWGPFPAGSFGNGGRIPRVGYNIHLEVGLFEDTLPPFLAKQAGREAHLQGNKRFRLPVGFVNIDNDLYEGALFILTQLQNRFDHGSVIHFHEFFSRRKKEPTKCVGNDEMKALYDFLKMNQVDYNLQFMPYHVQYQEPAVFRVIKST